MTRLSRSDLVGLAGVVAIVAIFAAQPIAGGIRIGQDTATQFYPWYGHLGERLRAGGVPEWNPHQFAGAPLAADPQSGWTYLLAMLPFALLPLAVAVPVYIVAHLFLASLTSYVFGRVLGLKVVGALVVATAYPFTGILYGRVPSGPASVQVGAWIPSLLLGVELAVRARSWPGRLGGWTLTGVALSQILAGWIGQVSYYALLLLGGYVLYRTVIAPPGHPADRTVIAPPGHPAPLRLPTRLESVTRWLPDGVRARLTALVAHGAIVLIIGFGLAAAGIAPRLEYNTVSNVAGGLYRGEGATEISGTTRDAVLGRLLGPTIYYPGAATVALAIAGLLLAWRRHPIPFFFTLVVIAVILAAPTDTIAHRLFYLLPFFEELHQHWPERTMLVTYLAPAVMAGAAVDQIARRSSSRGLMTIVALAPIAVMGLLILSGAMVPAGAATAMLAITLVIVTGAWSATNRALWPVPMLALLIVGADLFLTNQALAGQGPFGGFYRVNLERYYAPTDGARFLHERQAEDGPFRFAGYDPDLMVLENGLSVLYRYQFADPQTRDLIVNNRATILGLEDTQGYNPIQIQRYVEFVAAINSGPQEYHGADVYPAGLTSPLLHLLNVRFLVIPAAFSDDRDDLRFLSEEWTIAYEDAAVRIVENPNVLPRAWVVHEATEVAEGEALDLLSSGQVDPSRTALLESSPPAALQATVESAATTIASEVIFHDTGDPDQLRLTVRTDEPGLVVFSEIAYPAWTATVDGVQTPVVIANHALRAVSVPAGEHVVELRFQSTATQIGLAISLLTIGALLGAWIVAVATKRSAL